MDWKTVIKNHEHHAEAFEKRVQAVCQILQNYGIDSTVDIQFAVNRFYDRTGYTAEYLQDLGGIFHESTGHVAACATSNSPADEGRAGISEFIFCDGSYHRLDPNREDQYTYELDPQSRKTVAFEDIDQRSIDIRIKKGKEDLFSAVQCLEKRMVNGLLAYSPEDASKKKLWEDQLENDSSLSENERRQLFDRVSRQHEFFLKLTGNRPVSAFSAASFAQLPAAFLGVIYNQRDSKDQEPFKTIPEEILTAIEQEIDDYDMALAA